MIIPPTIDQAVAAFKASTIADRRRMEQYAPESTLQEAVTKRVELQNATALLTHYESAIYMDRAKAWLNDFEEMWRDDHPGAGTPSVSPPSTPAPKKRRAPRGASINRCSDCGKFVPLEQGEGDDPELEIYEASGEGLDVDVTVSAAVTLTLTCGECSSELAEVEVDDKAEAVTLTHLESCTVETADKESGDGLEVEVGDCSLTDRIEGKGRYGKHYYGMEITLTVSCPECGATADGMILLEEQASAFESCQ